jgi:hypothetical protein
MYRNLRNFIVILAVIFAVNTSVSAQSIQRQVVATAGRYTNQGSIAISFTVGEPVADLFPNVFQGKALTAGFQQPDPEIQENIYRDSSNYFVLFPNPTIDGKTKLGFRDVPNGTYTIDIIDALGRVVQTTTVEYFNHNFLYVDLDVTNLARAVYFIRIRSDKNFRGELKLMRL